MVEHVHWIGLGATSPLAPFYFLASDAAHPRSSCYRYELEKDLPGNSKTPTSKDSEEGREIIESSGATVIVAGNAKTDRGEVEATELQFTAGEAAALVALQFQSPAEEAAVAREISSRSLSGWAGWKRKYSAFRERCVGNGRRVKVLQ